MTNRDYQPSPPPSKLDFWHANWVRPEALVQSFIPRDNFWSLTSPKSHIILGSRGSGKSAFARMLSHQYMSMWNHEEAVRMIKEQSFLGTYVSTTIPWVGTLKNKPWQTPEEAEQFFRWRMNLASCQAFLTTMDSCLRAYSASEGMRAAHERKLVGSLAKEWGCKARAMRSISDLEDALAALDHEKEEILGGAVAGVHPGVGDKLAGRWFNAELFTPLVHCIDLLSSELSLEKHAVWAICIDEAEFLELNHHRILNTLLRSHSSLRRGVLSFKITTLPYAHYTLETNTPVALNPGHDFDYVYIDADPIHWSENEETSARDFAEKLFSSRLRIEEMEHIEVSLYDLLGDSELLSPAKHSKPSREKLMALIRKHCNKETIARAESLEQDPGAFADQIDRKLRGILLLREHLKKNSRPQSVTAYSGLPMLLRCTDMNPRRLLHAFSSLIAILRVNQTVPRQGRPLVNPREQNRLLKSLSRFYLDTTLGEGERGHNLHDFLTNICSVMRSNLHEKLLGTDLALSIRIRKKSHPNEWKLAQLATDLGLLRPGIEPGMPNPMPRAEGEFHVAYTLAPSFDLLPRKGVARRLEYYTQGVYPGQMELFTSRPNEREKE